MVTNALTLVTNLVSGMVIARTLGPTGRGELTAILGVTQLLSWACSFGCGQAVGYHQARHPEHGARLLGTWLFLLLPMAAVAIACGECVLPWILAAQSDEALGLARVFLFSLFAAMASDLIYGILVGDHDFLFFSVMRPVLPAMTTVMHLALWRASWLTVGTALTASAVSVTICVSIAMVRAVRRFGVAAPDFGLARSTLWYGLRAHGANLGGMMQARLDMLIMPAFLGAGSMGLYAIATSVSWMVVTLSGTLAVLVLPAAARRGRDGTEAVIGSLRATLAIATALAIVLELVADVGVRLVYGPAFAGGILPLRLLLPGTVLLVATSVLCSGLLAATRPLSAAAAQVPGIVTTLCGLLLFLRSGGIIAAALVSTTSYALTFVAALVLYRRATGLRWRDFLPRRAGWRPVKAAELQVKLIHG